MMRPGLRTLLLGSRITAPLIMLGSAYVTWRWWQDGTQGLSGLVAIGLFVAAFRAMGEVSAYRQWRADWRAMTGASTRPSWLRKLWRPLTMLIAAVAMIAAMFYASQPEAGPQIHALLALWIVGGGALAMAIPLGRLIRRMMRRSRPRRAYAVTAAIRRPVFPSRSLRECYRRLPPHCQSLLKASALKGRS